METEHICGTPRHIWDIRKLWKDTEFSSCLKYHTNSLHVMTQGSPHEEGKGYHLDVVHVGNDSGQAIFLNEVTNEGDALVVGCHLRLEVGQVVAQVARAADAWYAIAQLARGHQYVRNALPLHTSSHSPVVALLLGIAEYHPLCLFVQASCCL